MYWGESNESFVRDDWERTNRHLRQGKITMEEFQLSIELSRSFLGEDQWDYWMKKIRRPKLLLHGR